MKRIKRGAVTIPIYATPSGGYSAWTVSYSDSTGRHRKKFATERAATEYAEGVAESILRGQAFARSFSDREAASMARALELLTPTGKSLELACAEYAEAHAQRLAIHPRTARDVLDEMLAQKRQDGLSAVYLKELTIRLGKFADAFTGSLASITGEAVDAWLRAMPLGARTRNNYRTAIVTLAAFAKAKKYLAKEWSEMDAVGTAKESQAKIEILTPREFRKLLDAAPYGLRGFLCIAAFAGLRHEEILRLDWADVRKDHIEVHAANAKTASRRLAPMPPNLRDLLAAAPKSGPVCSGVVHMKLRRLADKIGMVWKHNALRHSFISYRVASIQDVAQVALEAGNSPRMIFTNYREVVTPERAGEWFAIGLDSVTNPSLKSRPLPVPPCNSTT